MERAAVDSEALTISDFERIETKRMDAPSWMTAAADIARVSGGSRMGVCFGTTGDPLGDAKVNLRTNATVRRHIDDNPESWDVLEAKILIQGAKTASLLAYAHHVDQHRAQQQPGSLDGWLAPGILDAAPWLPTAFALVAFSHITTLRHEAMMTDQSILQDRIVRAIKRAGQDWNRKTQRHLCRSLNLPATVCYQTLRMLMEAGVIREALSPTGRSKHFNLA